VMNDKEKVISRVLYFSRHWSLFTRLYHYRGLQIIVTLFAVAALSLHFVQGRLSAPKDAGGDPGATEEVVTIICNPQ